MIFLWVKKERDQNKSTKNQNCTRIPRRPKVPILQSCTHDAGIQCSMPISIVENCIFQRGPEVNVIATNQTQIIQVDSDDSYRSKTLPKNFSKSSSKSTKIDYPSKSAHQIGVAAINIEPATSGSSDCDSSPPINYRFGSLPHKDSHNIIKVKHLEDDFENGYSYDTDEDEDTSTVSVSQLNDSDESHDSESNVSITEYTVNMVSESDKEEVTVEIEEENQEENDKNRPQSIVAPPIRFNPLPSTGLQTFVYVI